MSKSKICRVCFRPVLACECPAPSAALIERLEKWGTGSPDSLLLMREAAAMLRTLSEQLARPVDYRLALTILRAEAAERTAAERGELLRRLSHAKWGHGRVGHSLQRRL